jgi:dihydroneopterin aldolase
MSDHAYLEVLNQVQQFSAEEKFRLLEDLMELLKRQMASKPSHSILELEGLGKEIWEGIDVDQYLEEERNSWDG